MSHDLVSFDLDGTLVDTAAEIAEAANRTLDCFGIARRPESEITMLIGAGTRELMSKLLARCASDDPSLADPARIDDIMDRFDLHYAATTGTSAEPYPGCREALGALQQAGVRLVCTTNKEIRHARRVLAATGLDCFFELVIGGDSLPEKKPHPSVLRHAARQLGVPLSRCAHLGDSAIDVAAARNAGVSAWAVSYGYNAGKPIADADPDHLFDDLMEVAEHVLAGHRRAA